ncbi:MAG: baseplate J/gp47 family protein [Cellulosilyticaceae bacterium]
MITKNGYVVNSEEEWYKQILSSMKAQFPDMSENPANLLIVLARIMAKNENARDYDTVKRYSDAYVSTATGMHLDKAVRTAGISRLVGRRAVGSVKIIKSDSVAQVILPSGTIMKSGELEYRTTNTDAIIINKKETVVEIASVGIGSLYNLPKNSKFKTILNFVGIDGISSDAGISGGTDTETDSELRERYFSRMAGYSNSSIKGILDRVSAIGDVLRVDGDENNKDVQYKDMLPHSFIVYVEGGTETDIANAIMESKPAGIQTNGNVSVNVEVSGKQHEIKFSRFVNQNVFYDIEVIIDKTITSPNFIDNLKSEIIKYTSKNNSIISYELSNHISKTMQEVIGVKKLNFGLSENPTVNSDLVAEVGKIFFTDASKIKVVVL